MPQNAMQANVALTSANLPGPLHMDADGYLKVSAIGSAADGSNLVAEGSSAALNVTAAAVVKATPGRVVRIVVVSPGTTSGAFTVNNCATTGAATTANTIWTLPYNGAANVAGAVFTLDMPASVGIVVSAVPGGGSPQLSISYS